MVHNRRRRQLLYTTIITLLPLIPLLTLPTLLAATDPPPAVLATNPPDHATNIPLNPTLTITFTEPITLTTTALLLDCTHTGPHPTTTTGGPTTYHFQPTTMLQHDEQCFITIFANQISDHDTDDPPDHMFTNHLSTFTTTNTPPPPPPPPHILINEADAHTTSDPIANNDFIELYDGGTGHTNLTGLTLALYEGQTNTIYATHDLATHTTNTNGYTLLNTTLHDGPAAIALYAAPPTDLPIGTPITTNGLLDALVYTTTSQPDDPELLQLLQPNQPQVNENNRHQSPTHSLQRCPNGQGNPRQTTPYRQNPPTPNATNNCTPDEAPDIIAKSPPQDALELYPNATLTLTFTEPVHLSQQTFQINCAQSGNHPYTISGNNTTYTLHPTTPFAHGEHCTVHTRAQHVHDTDTDDPPDTMIADDFWDFTTLPPVADHILINELDSDTPGPDTAEFIELYDGGTGHTDLTGLALVLYNGETNTSYHTFDLDGRHTNAQGYFLLGNTAIPGIDLTFPDTLLQNGPDAIALYNASTTHFPNGTPITATIATSIRLIDALVYGRPHQTNHQLLLLLNPGQTQTDENRRANQDTHSSQRCPNGSGGQRNATPFKQNPPTPGAINNCITDTAPIVASTIPDQGETIVPINSKLHITFSEPVQPSGQWFQIQCDQSGSHSAAVNGGPQSYTLTPNTPFATEEQCTITILAAQISDLDNDDPPDEMATNYVWQFTTAPPIADFVLINELDSDTSSSDTAEFIELYDGGAGNTNLTGLTLVFFNGSTDTSYYAIDLAHQQTNNNGYFLIGNPALTNADLSFPNNTLQNGPDAVALYAARATAFPNGSPLTTANLIDAVVYDTADADDPELLTLLNPGQPQASEHGRSNAETHSLQRCPNGTGGRRNTQSYRPDPPTPKASNICTFDSAPTVASVTPAAGATAIPINTPITITFSEPVDLIGEWYELTCATSGRHTLQKTGGPTTYNAIPATFFAYGESCAFTIRANNVHDRDQDDPPNAMAANYTWSFSTAPPPPGHILINELDSDTTGSDTAEFIELYDGGTGNTDLTSLTLVFYNGSTDTSYRAIPLDGRQTNSQGYFVIGNSETPNVDLIIPNGSLQNGPDAVALYAYPATAFPTDTPITTSGLLDAIVYTAQGGESSPALLSLLHSGQPIVNENGRNNREGDSNQRCSNGSGNQRQTAAFLQDHPTPGRANDCIFDPAPQVAAVTPVPGAKDIPTGTTIKITFTEPVLVQSTWVTLNCNGTSYNFATNGGPTQYTLTPTNPLAPGSQCTTTIAANHVSDLDQDDPPDTMSANYTWQFSIAQAPIASHILINELDADTAGSDTAEFIELYDGGTGHTDLTGLSLVFYNGSTDTSYRAISLDGHHTSPQGYFTIGNSEVPNVDLIIPNGILQNGPDAVALYARSAASFPAGTPITTSDLLDAIVYTAQGGEASPTLLSLLHSGQPIVNENGRSNREGDSNQRCPNATGGQRKTATFLQDHPTPGRPNDCTFDTPPQLLTTTPASNAKDVPIGTTIKLTFSEPVLVQSAWAALTCGATSHNLTTSGGPTQYTLTPTPPLAPGTQCTATIHAAHVTDLDHDDPPDTMPANYTWQFTTAAVPTADFVLINEVDSDTAEADTAEFIELYDGGIGHTPLTGLTIVLFNGNDDRSYRTIDLTGQQTDANGYFLIGNAAVPGVDLTFPNNILQNGPDAVALYARSSTNFPNGTPLTTNDLLDAVVYGTADPDDTELLTLLNPNQPQVDESSRGAAETHSNQRCPNGAGPQRQTTGYLQNPPTPGTTNNCQISQPDQPPTVIAVTPLPNANNIAPNTSMTITFSEPIQAAANAFALTCSTTGTIPLTVADGPIQYTITPIHPLTPGESCTATIHAAHIHDLDTNDPPDTMTTDYTWQFTTEAAKPVDPPNFILINEVDADTPGTDTAEFIELYDGGRGHTDLTGLILVLYNGSNDLSYRTIDLAGHQTNAAGYFLLGNPELPAVDLTFANGQLQNGPDAIALYTGTAADFPNGSELTTNGLLDALVYGTADPTDNDLLILLNNNQPQVDEDGRNAKDTHSNQRCPNGTGGGRNTASYLQNPPTPKAANNCQLDQPDEAPTVHQVTPPPNANSIDPHTQLTITFSEPVHAAPNAITLTCPTSGNIELTIQGSQIQYTITPIHPLPPSQTCTATIHAAAITDLDTNDPPDNMAEDYTWQFTIETIDPTDPPDFILINEVDADTTGADTAEFIELYDGGIGNTDLSGLTLVLYNGATNTTYRTFDLTGHQTNAAGYFLLGNAAVPTVDLTFGNSQLQNGPDAIALYAAPASDFPNGTPLTTTSLLDALVYTTNDQPNTELLTLLNPGQQAANENGRDNKDLHSNQRCPNGAGGQRNTDPFEQHNPTPKAANNCTIDQPDQPPTIIEALPAHNATDIDPNTQLTITFSEPVHATTNAFTLICTTSGNIDLSTNDGPTQYTLTPLHPLSFAETCTATIHATAITDLDDDDPPDQLQTDYTWSFTIRTADIPPPPPLTASFIHNGPVVIGQTSHFTATTTTTPLAYTWDFGDGSTAASGAAVTHTYAAPGTYTVILTVSNGRETATAVAIHRVINYTLYFPFQVRPNSDIITGDAQ